MKLLRSIFNRSRINFFDNLVEHASLVYEVYQILIRFMREQGERHELAEEIMRAERAGDDLRRILIDQLNRTLITPLDREDIYCLSREIDNVLDDAKKTIEEMIVFEVDPTPDLALMSEIMKRGTLELCEAFQNLHKHPAVSREHAINAKRTENHMHHIYLEATVKLFNAADVPAGYIFKMREIFRHLNRSSNHLNQAADLLLDIIVKLE